MKKSILRNISIGLLCSFMCSSVVYAATPQGKALTSTKVVSQLLPENVVESNSRMQPTTRGVALSESILTISNQGRGSIGVVATSAFHQAVDWGMLTVFLDVLTEAGNWKCVKTYEFEFTPEDEADGELTSMTVGFLITDQPAGHYYRLRSIHEVEFIDHTGNVRWEGHAPRTDGILITDTP